MQVLRVTTIRAIIAASVLFCACGREPGRGVSTITDSAGVRIINSTAPVWSGEEAWRLADAPDLTIGESAAGAAEEFTQIRRIFSMPDGSIAVVNQNRPPEIRVFDGDGTWLRTIGGAGAGPGEFRFIWDAWLAPPDTLIAFDAGLARFTHFAPDGTVLGTETFVQQASAGLSVIPWDRFADGTYLARNNRFVPVGTTGSGRSRSLVLRADAIGQVVDTIGEFPDVDFITLPSGAPSVLRYGAFSVQVVSGNLYYRGVGDDFTIDAYDGNGAHLTSMRRTFTPRPVSADLLDQLRAMELDTVQPARREHLEKDWAERPHAPFFPAYGNNWLTDRDGNLWVPAYVTGLDDQTEWTVFSDDGRWLGSVTMRSVFRPEEIGHDYVLGVWRDELDVQSVRRYPILKRP